VLASDVLQHVHDNAPKGHFTLGWLTGTLHKQSFGLIILVLSIVAAAPGISVVGGLLLLIPAAEMIAGRPAPSFPRWVADRPLPTQHLGAVVRSAIAMLKHVEKMIFPRWPTPPQATKCVVGIAVMLLTVRLILVPLPLSNIVPALLIALISLAYLEEDGLMLSIGLVAGCVGLAFDLWVVWELIHGAKRLKDFI
jgi:hypothetical protein